MAVRSVASGFSRKTAFAPQAATAAARQNDPARELINRVIRVKGGLGPLKNVRSVVADAQTTLRLEQPLVSTTRTYVVYPGKFRVDATVNGADVVQVFNAGAAWVRDPGGVHDAPTAMRDDFAAAVERDIIPLLIAAAEGRVTARLLPDEGRGDDALKVLELRGPQLPPTRLYINQQMLVARQTYSTAGPDGTPVQVEELFSDYRPVEGIRVPFEASVRRDGRPLLDRTLTRVVINGPVDEQLFARPQ